MYTDNTKGMDNDPLMTIWSQFKEQLSTKNDPQSEELKQLIAANSFEYPMTESFAHLQFSPHQKSILCEIASNEGIPLSTFSHTFTLSLSSKLYSDPTVDNILDLSHFGGPILETFFKKQAAKDVSITLSRLIKRRLNDEEVLSYFEVTFEENALPFIPQLPHIRIGIFYRPGDYKKLMSDVQAADEIIKSTGRNLKDLEEDFNFQITDLGNIKITGEFVSDASYSNLPRDRMSAKANYMACAQISAREFPYIDLNQISATPNPTTSNFLKKISMFQINNDIQDRMNNGTQILFLYTKENCIIIDAEQNKSYTIDNANIALTLTWDAQKSSFDLYIHDKALESKSNGRAKSKHLLTGSVNLFRNKFTLIYKENGPLEQRISEKNSFFQPSLEESKSESTHSSLKSLK